VTTPAADTQSPTTDREVSARRVLSAPPALVFAALTDPMHLANWWGPVGFKTTTWTFDARVGGQWRYVMVGPDGREYHNLASFVEIDPPRRLVLQHVDAEGCEPGRHSMTITLDELPGGKTELSWRIVFRTIARRTRRGGSGVRR
jgi:uncharacterized protein YndB with AHSA1/START domain